MKLTHRSTSPARALRSLVLLGLLAGTVAACSDDTTDPTPIPGATLTIVPNLRAEDISADGSTVLLSDFASPTADFYFYDVAAGTTTLKGSAGDGLWDFTTGISNGLRVSAIHGKPENAGLWQEGAGWQDLGSIHMDGCEFDSETGAQDLSSGWDIDSAGHTTVGLVWNLCNAEAFLWTDASGAGNFVALDLIGDADTLQRQSGRATAPPSSPMTARWSAASPRSTRMSAATPTGSTAARPSGPSTGVGSFVPSNGVFTDDSPGEVLAISGNGLVVTGVWNQMPFIWSSALGTINVASGTYEGYFGYGQATALNGQVVYGTMTEGFFGTPFPFFWTQAGGVKSILDIATENGITLPENYWWQSVVAASADGTIIVGTAYDETFNYNTLRAEGPGLDLRPLAPTGSPWLQRPSVRGTLAHRRPCRIHAVPERITDTARRLTTYRRSSRSPALLPRCPAAPPSFRIPCVAS